MGNIYENFPIVERKVEFDESDFITNPHLLGDGKDSIPDKAWQEYASNALTFTDNNTIYQYGDAFPVVIYKCSDEAMMMPSNRLNGFIDYIAVVIADAGRSFSVGSGRMEQEYEGSEAVAYYCDSIGSLYEIAVCDIMKMLWKKPQLVVTSEGLLVFYTRKEILVTLDCVHYAWVHDVDTNEDAVIENIKVCKNHCEVIIDTGKLDDKDNPIKSKYELKFTIDLLDRGMIEPFVTKK